MLIKKKIALLLALISTPLCADFTVTDEVNATQDLTGDGGVGLITSTGSIIVDDIVAVDMNGDPNQTLTNNGTISTESDTDDLNMILNNGGDNATIVNNGTITCSAASTRDVVGFSNVGGSSLQFTNNGAIDFTPTNLANTGILSTNGSNNVFINNGTMRTGTTGGGPVITLSNQTNSSVTNNGTITLPSGTTLILFDGAIRGLSSSNCTYTNTGTITSLDSIGIFLNGGNNNTIANSGTIQTFGDEGAFGSTNAGIQFSSADTTISNTGTISTAGDRAHGLALFGVRANLTQSSAYSVTTAGDASHGINSTEDDTTIANSSGGSITTSGAASHGILASGDDVTITQSGTLSTSGNASHGMSLTGLRASVRNTSSNSIITTGDGSHGINSTANNATITNTSTGLISTSGTGSHGILSTGDNALITNCGRILTSGALSAGIISAGDNVIVTNGGLISSPQFGAIVFTGQNPSLNLLAGSSIIGGIGSAFPINLSIASGGANRVISLGSDSFSPVSSQDPFVVVGSTTAVINPTGFEMQTAMLEDLTDGIFGALYTNRSDYLNLCCCPGPSLWIQGFGSSRDDDASTPYCIEQGGLLIGLSNGRCGLFAGASFEKGTVGANTDCDSCGCCSISSLSEDRIEVADVTSYFGGYTIERFFCSPTNSVVKNLFLGGGLTGGYVRWDNRRTVENNLQATGLEHADVHNTVWMFAAEGVANTKLCDCITKVRPGAGMLLRYAGYYMGDYRESDSAANLDVFQRTVQIVKLRGELSLTFNKGPGKYLEPYLAAAGRFQIAGNRVTSVLLGVPLDFNLDAPDNIAETIGGIRGEWDWGSSGVFFNLEGMWDDKYTSRVLGEVCLHFDF